MYISHISDGLVIGFSFVSSESFVLCPSGYYMVRCILYCCNLYPITLRVL